MLISGGMKRGVHWMVGTLRSGEGRGSKETRGQKAQLLDFKLLTSRLVIVSLIL